MVPDTTGTGVDPGIGAVIVAYNSAQDISDCVGGCLADPAVRRVIVVDNSNDAATERAVASLGDTEAVEYLPAPRNLGYAQAANLGANRLLKLPELTHIAIVNPDLSLSSAISGVLGQVGDRNFSVLSADINDLSEETHARYATTAGTELKKALFGASSVRCVPRPRLGQVLEVPEVSGALMVLRAETFAELDGFDERFELYYEDVDLCQRAVQLAPLLFVGMPIGLHSGGASYKAAMGPAYRAFRVSRLRFLRKRYGIALGGLLGVAFAALELTSRSVTRQPEGLRCRWRSFGDQLREARHPGSVSTLQQPGAIT